MKNFTLLTVFFLLVSFFSSPLSLSATNYTSYGVNLPYALNNGDTLRLVSGYYAGSLLTFNSGSVVIISAGATFSPAYMNSPAGKIINYGVASFSSLGTHSGFAYENNNITIVSGDLSLYEGSTQTWTNNVGSKISISGNFSMNQAVVTNYAGINVGGNFSLYKSSSNLINRGLITIDGNFAMSDGILNNQNRITTNEFNAYGGQVNNEGSIIPKGNMTFNNSTAYTNKCLLITSSGFTNYGTFQNNGMLWVGRSGTSSDHFYNSGTFTNGATAQVKAVKLTNYGTLNGGGSYYINGETTTSGTVGRSGTTTDTIKIYDVTRTNSNAIFDNQWGTIYNNVVYRILAQPDTNNVTYSGCSVYFRSDLGTMLPVEWSFFDAKLVQLQPVLNWSATYDATVQFVVEKSYDNINFNAVATIASTTTKAYTFIDETIAKNRAVYYRIKGVSTVNGTVRFTETKMLKINSTSSILSAYPNPTKEAATIAYKSERAEQITVRVRNISGQQLTMKNMMAVIGTNTIKLSEISNLQAGVYFVEVLNASAIIGTERIVKQ